MLRRYAIRATAFLAVLALSMPAFAQGGRAEINGTVYDQDKAVMPGVGITVTSQDTGSVRTTVTSGEGRFTVPTLVPGVYTVQAELQGFQNATQTDLRLAVGQELTLNLTLALAGIAENLTVTAQAPIVEVTTNRIGTNITNAEIDSLPAANRSQLSLMQMVPGLVPNLNTGSFEGGQYNANGQATSANVFLTDGAYNNDSRRGGSQGNQSAVSLDTMAEYQVLTHQYSAEYGGGTGVVVNAVTRSGSNRFAGRGFEYFKDNKLDATEFFLKEAGEENPDYGSNIFGGSLGGPLVRNKWFFFVNGEKTLRKDAANVNFPAEAQAVAAQLGVVNYSATQDFTVANTFVRTDVQVSGNHNLSVRWNRAHELTERDTLNGSDQLESAWRHENDAGDQVYSFAFTSVLGNHATNEFRVGHVQESLLQGPTRAFDDNWKFIGLGGVDQFDVGVSVNDHPDYLTGTSATLSADRIRDYTVDDAFTLLKPGWGGDHTFKFGVGWSSNGSRPQTVGANAVGTFFFPTNTPFDPAIPSTYPWQFTIRVLGQLDYEQIDHRSNFYVQDKWQINRQVTLNLGVRYDYQTAVPQTKDAVAPRLGLAWDPTGNGTTVIRAGGGKFYQIQGLGILNTFQTSGVITPINQFNTGEVASPAETGVIPANVCLQPTGNNGLAVISPACRATLEATRAQVAAGAFVNRDPTIEGDRGLPYIWSFSGGVKQQLSADLAVSIDYVGNRGRDQTTLLDKNVGPTNPATGRITRLGVAGMPAETVAQIPASALGFNFRRVLQYTTDERFNTDFNSLEIGLEKRMANRWSGRVAYTLARARGVGAISDNLNPRDDYGRLNTDNRHAVAMSANVDVWKGLGAGLVFRAYSGYPINETVGSDVNGDNVPGNPDRPVRGVHDLTRPILSEVDANGRAIRNGIDGEKTVLLDGRVQYIWDIRGVNAGLFLELYNLMNQNNFGNPTGNRNSSDFMVPDEVGQARSMQLGVRVTF